MNPTTMEITEVAKTIYFSTPNQGKADRMTVATMIVSNKRSDMSFAQCVHLFPCWRRRAMLKRMIMRLALYRQKHKALMAWADSWIIARSVVEGKFAPVNVVPRVPKLDHCYVCGTKTEDTTYGYLVSGYTVPLWWCARCEATWTKRNAKVVK